MKKALPWIAVTVFILILCSVFGLMLFEAEKRNQKQTVRVDSLTREITRLNVTVDSKEQEKESEKKTVEKQTIIRYVEKDRVKNAERINSADVNELIRIYSGFVNPIDQIQPENYTAPVPERAGGLAKPDSL